jgi:hypothetical protein
VSGYHIEFDAVNFSLHETPRAKLMPHTISTCLTTRLSGLVEWNPLHSRYFIVVPSLQRGGVEGLQQLHNLNDVTTILVYGMKTMTTFI